MMTARLRQNVRHHVSVDIGQAIIAAGVAVGEFLVIDAEQVQNRGVKIVHVHFVLRHRRADLVGAAVGDATLHSATRQPG